jgi:hypothetical protein
MSNNKAKDRNSEVNQKQINITEIVKKEKETHYRK